MKPGDMTVFHDHGGGEQAAIVTKQNEDGSVDLHVLTTTHKGVEVAPGTAPMTCSSPIDFDDVLIAPSTEAAVAAALPAELQRPTLTSIPQDVGTGISDPTLASLTEAAPVADAAPASAPETSTTTPMTSNETATSPTPSTEAAPTAEEITPPPPASPGEGA